MRDCGITIKDWGMIIVLISLIIIPAVLGLFINPWFYLLYIPVGIYFVAGFILIIFSHGFFTHPVVIGGRSLKK